MKFSIALLTLSISSMAFSFQLDCETRGADGISRVQFLKPKGEHTFFLQRRGHEDRGLIQSLARHLNVPFKTRDIYRLSLGSTREQVSAVSPTNPLIGYMVFGFDTGMERALLQHQYVCDKGNGINVSCVDDYPFVARFMSMATEQTVTERYLVTYKKLDIEMKLEPIPYTTIKETVSFSPGSCRGGN